MEKQYWIDFSGYLKIKAKNETEANEKFWKFINEHVDLSYTDLSDDVWDVDGIEEVSV